MLRASEERSGSDPFHLRRLVLIGALVGLVLVVVAVLTLLVGTNESEAGFDEQFVAACRRSAVAEDRCRCALAEWNRSVAPAERQQIDEELAKGADLPAALQTPLATC